MKKPLSFVMVGSGWRSLFFVRIAQRFPEEFRMLHMLCRSEEKAAEMQEKYGLPATTDEALCDASKPDFVVVAVNRVVLYDTVMKWAEKGYPVLSETPLGTSVEELKTIWEKSQNGEVRIQVAEQYHRYPIIAAGLHAIAQGKLGDPYNVTLTVAHDYHGVSMIRRMLCAKPQNMTLRGKVYSYPVEETDSRQGPIKDGTVNMKDRRVVTIEFADGKTAWYDFSGVQYHSFIRSRHINVQGPRGEWNDSLLRWVDDKHEPHLEQLLPKMDSRYESIFAPEMLEESKTWNPSVFMSNAQDEFAIASMLYDMRDYIENGIEVYPLAEALTDAYTTLLIEEAGKNPGKEIHSEPMPFFES